MHDPKEDVYFDVQAALLNSECSPAEALRAAVRALAEFADSEGVPFVAPASQAEAASLRRRYEQAGAPVTGHVSAEGLVLLPPTVCSALAAPTSLTFSYFENGALLVVPEHVLKRWAAEDED